MVVDSGNGRTIGYVPCFDCELNGPDKKPCFRVRVEVKGVGKMIQLLKEHRGVGGRGWVTVTITGNDPNRLRLLTGKAPAKEENASEVYLRGEIFRVNPTERSCNITFSEQNGIPSFVSRLETVREHARRFLEIRVPNRHREKDLIEFIPDRDLEASESAEHQKLAATGQVLASSVWEDEDFSDWESQDA